MDVPLAVSHLLEMLEDRGEDTGPIKEHIEALHGDYTPLSQSIYDTWKTDRTAVVFTLTKTFFQNYVKNYLKDPEIMLHTLYERPRILLITSEVLTPSLQTVIQTKDRQHQHAVPAEEIPIFQVLTLKELQYNPSRHILVPKHEWIPEATVKEILEKYQVKSKIHLPHIQRTDKMARWLGLRAGDVVKITRPNENSGIYYYYRCCV
jgi:DNA-directed RNA polymerase subunit H (RpoH/RPB5)